MEPQPPSEPALNPYAPPSADANAADRRPGPDGLVLASRMSRLGAAFLDGLLYSLAFIPALVDGITSGTFKMGKEMSPLWWAGTKPLQLVTVVAWLVLFGIQSYLVAQTGQTVGKRISRVRIVRADGSPAGFVRGVLARAWVFTAIANIPKAGAYASLLDVLFIFRRDRRCLHDLLAGTKVVEKTP